MILTFQFNYRGGLDKSSVKKKTTKLAGYTPDKIHQDPPDPINPGRTDRVKELN